MGTRANLGVGAVGLVLLGALLGVGARLPAGRPSDAVGSAAYPDWVRSAQAAVDGGSPAARPGDPSIARLARSRNIGAPRALHVTAAAADYARQAQRAEAAAKAAAADNAAAEPAADSAHPVDGMVPAEEPVVSSVAGLRAARPVFVVDPTWAKAYAAYAVYAWGWGGDEYTCLESLWERESNWRADAHNPGSGAYGIPQSLPGDKMATAGADWQTSAATQIDWGLGYIATRYGAPCRAWAHSESVNWY